MVNIYSFLLDTWNWISMEWKKNDPGSPDSFLNQELNITCTFYIISWYKLQPG